MNEQIESQESYLTFHLADELFAVNVKKVLEILEIPKLTKVPGGPAFMRGVVNLRGSVLPVIDTRIKFGLKPQADTIDSCIVVMNITQDNQEIMLGAIVDGVREVTEIESRTIQLPPSVGTKYKVEFIEGMVKMNEQFIMMLDVNRVFSTDEVMLMHEATIA